MKQVRRDDERLTSVIKTVAALPANDYPRSPGIVDSVLRLSPFFEQAPYISIDEATRAAEDLVREYVGQADISDLMGASVAILTKLQGLWDVDVPVGTGFIRFADMDRTWEVAFDFVFSAELTGSGLHPEFHPYAKLRTLLFGTGGPDIDPDIVAFRDGSVAIVIDCKYKSALTPISDDVYQIVSYAACLKAAAGVLVYVSPGQPWYTILGATAGAPIAAVGISHDQLLSTMRQASRFILSLEN